MWPDEVSIPDRDDELASDGDSNPVLLSTPSHHEPKETTVLFTAQHESQSLQPNDAVDVLDEDEELLADLEAQANADADAWTKSLHSLNSSDMAASDDVGSGLEDWLCDASFSEDREDQGVEDESQSRNGSPAKCSFPMRDSLGFPVISPSLEVIVLSPCHSSSYQHLP